MDCLQDELLVSILDRVTFGELIGKYCLVSKRWNRLCMEELPRLWINCDSLAGHTGEEALDSVVCGIVSKRRNMLKSLYIFMAYRLLTRVSIIASVSATIESILIYQLKELTQPFVNVLLECKGLKSLKLMYEVVEGELEVSGTWPRLNHLHMCAMSGEDEVDYVEKMVEACPALVDLELYVREPVSLRIRSSSLQKLFLHSWGEVGVKMEARNLHHLTLAGCATVTLFGLERLETLWMMCAVLKPSKLLQNVSCLRIFTHQDVDTRLNDLIDNLKNVPIRKLIVSGNVDLIKVVPLLAHCKELECWASQGDFQGLLNSFGEKCPALATVRLRLPSKEVLHLNLRRGTGDV